MIQTRTQAPLKRGQIAGFTLVEILVVMSLMTIVMLALGSALRTIAQTEDRIDQRLTRADEFRNTTRFLRDTLGRVVLVRSNVPASSGVKPLLFVGTGVSVQWVGIMPANYGVGGRFFFRLAMESDSNSQPLLVLRYAPWQNNAEFPNWASAEFRVLSRQITLLSYRYQDNNGAWSQAWIDPALLPSRMQVTLGTASTTWPTLTIPLRALSSLGGQGGFTIGGGR